MYTRISVESFDFWLGVTMKEIPVQQAIGETLIHDIVRIVMGKTKDTPFRRGHVITEADISKLLDLGKEHIYVMEPGDEHLLHEEDVARRLYTMVDGENIRGTDVEQGKIEAIADVDGVLDIDVERLHQINSVGQLTIVTKWNHTPVKEGQKIAGMRCIPLLLPEAEVIQGEAIYAGKPIMNVVPYQRKTMGIVVTGSEVFHGRIQDAFTPIIEKRTAPYGLDLVARKVVTDNTEDIVKAIESVKAAGADIIFCTGGMSVDPDDLTPGAIQRCGRLVTYGLPVLPGSMVALAYMADGTPIMGLPGGVLFGEPSALDLFLPRLVANIEITKEDCIRMGHGGMF